MHRGFGGSLVKRVVHGDKHAHAPEMLPREVTATIKKPAQAIAAKRIMGFGENSVNIMAASAAVLVTLRLMPPICPAKPPVRPCLTIRINSHPNSTMPVIVSTR